MRGIAASVLASWLLVGLACSEREVATDDEEALRICAGYCDRFAECGVPLDTSSAECGEACADAEWVWGPDCRAEMEAQYACLTALTCDTFEVTVDSTTPYELKSCTHEQGEASICVSEHGGIEDD